MREVWTVELIGETVVVNCRKHGGVIPTRYVFVESGELVVRGEPLPGTIELDCRDLLGML